MINVKANQHDVRVRHCKLVAKLLALAESLRLLLQLKVSENLTRHVLVSDEHVQLYHSHFFPKVLVEDYQILSSFENSVNISEFLI